MGYRALYVVLLVWYFIMGAVTVNKKNGMIMKKDKSLDSVEFDGLIIPCNMLPQISELPVSLHPVAEIVGVRKTIELTQLFKGSSVFFPKLTLLRCKIRNSFIRKDYDNGLTARQLAIKYNLSDRQIWAIIGNCN